MNNTDPWMSDTNITVSVEKVGHTVFTHLRPSTRARRSVLGIGAVLAAMGLFTGGIAFGAAAYASPNPNPSSAPTAVQPSVQNAAFSVACYPAGKGDPVATQQFTHSNALLLEQAQVDPSSTCLASLHTLVATEKFGFAIRDEHTAGHDCGVFNTPGVAPFHFTTKTVGGLLEYSGTFKKPTTPLPANCVTVTFPAIPLSESMLATCQIDPKHAAVYILDGASAAATCKSNGHTLWRN
jgi:hypothetical protein